MATETLLGKLKRAVHKIKFLLNFSINRWKLVSIIGGASSSKKRLSFNDRPGLRACVDDSDPAESSRGLRRTTSYPSEDDIDNDIDQRADAFIANFYKQLQFERQISLQLRYCRGNTFDSSTSP
ncbi:cotton fiber protein [Perilla frutescens var. frutescens]|nr:cotton fiber protein [Perilla frutescens var. frutescens]